MTVGDIKVPKMKLDAAKRCSDAYKMARRLLPEFFNAGQAQNMHLCTKHAPVLHPKVEQRF